MFTHPFLLSIEILTIVGGQALDPVSFTSFVNLFIHLPLLVYARPLSLFYFIFLSIFIVHVLPIFIIGPFST